MAFKILSSKEQATIEDAIEAAKASKPKRQEPKHITELRETLETLAVGKMFYYPIAKDIRVSSKRNNVRKKLVDLGYSNCEVSIHPTDSAALLIKKVEADGSGEEGEA
jgi:hypothetical protein